MLFGIPGTSEFRRGSSGVPGTCYLSRGSYGARPMIYRSSGDMLLISRIHGTCHRSRGSYAVRPMIYRTGLRNHGAGRVCLFHSTLTSPFLIARKAATVMIECGLAISAFASLMMTFSWRAVRIVACHDHPCPATSAGSRESRRCRRRRPKAAAR